MIADFRLRVWQADRCENDVHCPRFRCRRLAENVGFILCKDYTREMEVVEMMVRYEK